MDNNLIKYISGFIDGQYFVVDQLYKGKQKFLPTEGIDNWYTKGYNDANNYYLNELSKTNDIMSILDTINSQAYIEVIRECYSKYDSSIKNTK